MKYWSGQGVVQDLVFAHMWLNLAALQGDADVATNRNELAKKMTPAQIAEAKKKAKRCMASGYKDCD